MGLAGAETRGLSAAMVAMVWIFAGAQLTILEPYAALAERSAAWKALNWQKAAFNS
jgi:hypothetical protein